MNDEEFTVLAGLLVTHRGVPIGRTSLVEVSPAYREGEPPTLWLQGFEPLPAYENIRPVVVRATEARAKLGFLGPVADPESDRRGREAKHAYDSVISEVELCDEQGRFIAVDHIQLSEGQRAGKPDYDFMGIIDEPIATVVARLKVPLHGDSDHEPPAA